MQTKRSRLLFPFLIVQFALALSVLYNLPFFRQIFGFLYLTFVPGLLIFLALAKVNNDRTEKVLFSMGLSISFLMIFGFFLNELSPFFGLELLSPWPFIILLSVVLVPFAYFGRSALFDLRLAVNNLECQVKTLVGIVVLGIPTLVFLSLLMINRSGQSFTLIVLIFLISMLVLLSASRRLFPPQVYPIGLIIIALALIFTADSSAALIGKWIIGWDQHIEYQAFTITNNRLWWDSASSIPFYAELFPSYSMLSVTIMPTVYSQLLQLDGTWIFKIIYPFIVAFVPLALYKLYSTQTNNRDAFLAAFFFISVSMGKGWGSDKQMIALFFYVLILLALFSKQTSPQARKIFLIVFCFGLVVSHYALTYVFIFMVLIAWIYMRLRNSSSTKIPTSFVVLFLVIAMAWFVFANHATSFYAFLNSMNLVIRSISDFLDVQTRGSALAGLGAVPQLSIFHQISTVIFIVTEFLIIVGFLKVIRNRRMSNFDNEYLVFAGINLLLLIMNVALPRLADTFLMDRFYQTTLVLLAPFCILGGKTVLSLISKFKKDSVSTALLCLIVLVPLFLFQTGFVYEIAKVDSYSYPLSGYRWDQVTLSTWIVTSQEVTASRWMSFYSDFRDHAVYSDFVAKYKVLSSYSTLDRSTIRVFSNSTVFVEKDYIYFRNGMTSDGKIYNGLYWWDLNQTTVLLENQNAVYSNGNCEIYEASAH